MESPKRKGPTQWNRGRYTFVIDIPPNFERDVKHGRRPTIQVNVDATAMAQAGRGAAYIQEILAQETADAIYHGQQPPEPPLTLVVRAKFNPNLTFSVVHRRDAYGQRHHFARNVPARRGVIREREHGTLEHLLAMPLRPSEIMLAKAWANGLVIVAAGDVVTTICREMAASRADCRFGGALCGGGDIPLFRNFTGYPDRHVGWFDAAVRTSGAPNLHHDEFSVRWYDADGEHA